MLTSFNLSLYTFSTCPLCGSGTGHRNLPEENIGPRSGWRSLEQPGVQNNGSLAPSKPGLVDPHHASRMMFHKQGLAEASELGCLLTGPVPHLIDNGSRCRMGLPETNNLSLTIFPRVRSSLSIEINTNSLQPPCSRPVVL